MPMGERLQNEKWFDIEHIEVYQWGRMIDEEDLKRNINSLLQLVFLDFHLCCHQCQREKFLEA